MQKLPSRLLSLFGHLTLTANFPFPLRSLVEKTLLKWSPPPFQLPSTSESLDSLPTGLCVLVWEHGIHRA